MKTYTTGEVAKICGLTSRKVAKLIDIGYLDGHIKESRYQRRSHRRVSVRDLIEFMLKHGIAFDELDDDAAAQKTILCRKVSELKDSIAKARKRGDIFLKVHRSSDILMDIFEQLGSLEDVRGITRNNSWAKVFEAMAALIKQHTKVCIANSKK